MEDTKKGRVVLEGFTEDAFVAAASLADLALSGTAKHEVHKENSEQANEQEPRKETEKNELLSSWSVGREALGQLEKEAGVAESLINTYDGVDYESQPNNVACKESEGTLAVVPKECSSYNNSLRVLQLKDSHQNASSFTFEDSESGSDDSFRREVGLKEKSTSVEDSNSTTRVEEEDNSDDEEGRTRCPCGRVESFGTMIQCDDCKVWQHAKCVGFRKLSEIPEHYFCEECRPDQVRENSIIYKKKYIGLKRSRKMNKSRAELERLESVIENSKAIKSSELKDSFCKDLRKKFQTPSKMWDDEVLFRKYFKYLRYYKDVEKESIIAGLEIISGRPGSEVEASLFELEKEFSEKEQGDTIHVKEENEENRLESNNDSIPAQEKVKKRKRTSILNESLDAGEKVASSREERKMQQILLQFKRLEEREEKRKHKSTGHVGTSPSCGNNDDSLSSRYKRSSHRTTSVDSDEKYTSFMEADEDESERVQATSIRDCLSTSSREFDDFKVEERIWEEENPSIPFLDLPGPSIVGSTVFCTVSAQGLTTDGWTCSLNDSIAGFRGCWKKEKLLKVFREQQDRLQSPQVIEPLTTVAPPIKKKVLMDIGNCFLSPASSSGAKTGVDVSMEECQDATSSTLTNVTFPDASHSSFTCLHTPSPSGTSESVKADCAIDSAENNSAGNSSGTVLKHKRFLDTGELGLSRQFHVEGVHNASSEVGESFKQVDSTYSSNIRQNYYREFSSVNNAKTNRNHSRYDEVTGNAISNVSKGRNFVGTHGESCRFFPEPDRNRKTKFHHSTRQWSPNKQPRKNFDAWRDFRKQNGWH